MGLKGKIYGGQSEVGLIESCNQKEEVGTTVTQSRPEMKKSRLDHGTWDSIKWSETKVTDTMEVSRKGF